MIAIFSVEVCAQEEIEQNGPELSSAEITQLRDELDKPPPSGATFLELTRYFQEHDQMAHRLGDLSAVEKNLRIWIASVSDTWAPRFLLAMVLTAGPNRDEGLALKEQLIREPSNPQDKVAPRSSSAA
jgi:hypothetical protein